MVSSRDKKLIKQLVSVKVIVVVVFILLVLPVFPFEVPIVCVTEPCENPVELKSGIDLIRQEFEEPHRRPAR